MSSVGWRNALVLGGIRSGKSAFAESLAGDGPVRYVATGAVDPHDAEWSARLAAHRARRPRTWITEELAGTPDELITLIAQAAPEHVLLVDDLAGWVTAQLDRDAAAFEAAVHQLAAAVRTCAARLIVVSPEVGLSVVPASPAGQTFADRLGSANQALAAACDAVAFVVAGQVAWLKPQPGYGLAPKGEALASLAATPQRAADTPPAARPQPGATRQRAADTPPVATTPVPAAATPPAATPRSAPEPPSATDPRLAAVPAIQPGMDLPVPDQASFDRAATRLAELALPGVGFGVLTGVVAFAAATQARPVPRPWQAVRMLRVHGDHAGGVAAGPIVATQPLDLLAAEADVPVQAIEAPPARPLESEDSLTADETDRALRHGWALAEAAADEGVELLLLAASGAGGEAAAAAVTAALTGAEAASLLARVPAPGGRFDDEAWMARCAALRDGLRRIRSRPRGALDLLAMLGGGDVALATGVLLGAAARRTPVLLDGPVGVAAALLARDLASQSHRWCLLVGGTTHPTVRHAADILDIAAVIDLELGLGEGAGALVALPVLRASVSLAAALLGEPSTIDDLDSG